MPQAMKVKIDENPWETEEFEASEVPEELLTSGPPKARSAIEEEISKIWEIFDVVANLDTKFRSHPILGGVNMIQEESISKMTQEESISNLMVAKLDNNV